MRMVDIIHKKREGGALSEQEIRFWIEGYLQGEIPDYQVSALLMAIVWRGMDAQETALLTRQMAASGEQVDLRFIPGIKVDKHSTGGVGDKTTLIVGPIVAACGVPVAKMSGRGLGHTGGTLDKLEAIPGFQTTVEPERFLQIVRENGLSVIGQTHNIAPADKKLYALRDVTGTVESLPLIASSIMSKKLAAGADAILLDVKTGSGAFMKTLEESCALAQEMVSIGEQNGRRTAALITNMDVPLGYAVGNALEVREAVETLKGGGPQPLQEICLQLAANMLCLAEKGPLPHCLQLARQALESGQALKKLREMVVLQGGDASVIDDPSRLPAAPYTRQVCAANDGFIVRMDTEQCGLVSCILGAGRARKEDAIDYGAGILFSAGYGQRLQAGDPLVTLYTSRPETLQEAERLLQEAITLSPQPPAAEKLLYARVTKEGIESL
ncbi:MAG: pyrimidine-nucleoside phosphorylase [Provencibacterium sp.]|jgi:pyrimidine-nucleoside phosphorylase|nr:pyrimidine-nucleoside phosphorylase [Provencibacterium sp.]